MSSKIALVFLAASLLPVAVYADPVTVYSSGGFVVPETITAIPAGFGSVGGNYFVPDASAGTLFVVPAGGGAPTAFATIPTSTFSGIFVPTGYTAPSSPLSSGNFLVTGNGSSVMVSSAGVVTTVALANDPEAATVAPAGFGTYGGKILLENIESNGTADILALNADGTTSLVATLPGGTAGFEAIGLGFAPAGFGSVGGDLLVGDSSSGNLYAVTASGTVTLFTTLPIPVVTDQSTGLRQFSFAPTGFGTFGGDLFISVSGSQSGGGSLGSVDIVNSSGSLIADLLQGTVGTPYDPRGLDFISNTQLLISDADPNILLATAANFSSTTPEPSSILLLLPGIVGTLAVRARSFKGRS